ncbi:hypothetical protein B0I08_107106 [Glaciihabitans tibetensis]|uniref:Uncharacterized protein n=1 Tax=Glaciihabitans tibetensis TaxID=1266600 RepID=A0A2T0VAM8_9MICO|nr:hypothetical protein [Glaciihabitans tibetensis]PRY67211.1 hypothetical protein B0I08_107106 [Glaciihabitans tibetensis]
MPLFPPVSSLASAAIGAGVHTAVDAVRGAAVGFGTLALALALALVVGIALLFRRRQRSTTQPGSSPVAPSNAALGIEQLTLHAGAILVRADDAVQSAENEVGFAVAQFGPERTRAFAEAVTDARAQVAEAFRLKQQLDDAYPDTDQQRRDWTKRVIALGESATRAIDEHTRQFTALRRSEADSPTRLLDLRAAIEHTRARLPASAATLQRLAARYDPALLTEVQTNAVDAEQNLAEAGRRADVIATRIAPGGVNAEAVTTELDAASSLVRDADRLLSAIEACDTSVGQAEAALSALVEATRTDLVESRAMRDAAPDPETGARVLRAIEEVDFVLAGTGSPSGPRNPVHDLGRLGSAVSTLDTALAGARNQQQRLAHARTALVGALVGARSEITVAKTFMASTHTDVDARTRLAEAERQLLLAEAASDPVDALDAARRAATAARDADALARYR